MVSAKTKRLTKSQPVLRNCPSTSIYLYEPLSFLPHGHKGYRVNSHILHLREFRGRRIRKLGQERGQSGIEIHPWDPHGSVPMLRTGIFSWKEKKAIVLLSRMVRRVLYRRELLFYQGLWEFHIEFCAVSFFYLSWKFEFQGKHQTLWSLLVIVSKNWRARVRESSEDELCISSPLLTSEKEEKRKKEGWMNRDVKNGWVLRLEQ